VGLEEPPAEEPPPGDDPPLAPVEPAPPDSELLLSLLSFAPAAALEPASEDEPPLSAPLGPSAVVLAGASAASPELLFEDLLVEVVDVVDAVLVRVASASAEVLLGGVISGVLRGVDSDTVPLPQALSTSPHSTTSRLAAPAARARLTRPGGPFAARRSGSR